MDKQILLLIEQMHVLMHRIEAIVNAEKDCKPHIRIIQFPKKEQPPTDTQGAVFSTAQERNSDVGTTTTGVIPQKSTEEQGTINFTTKEIQKMPKQIQGLMLVNRKRCHYRRKKTSKDKYTYEIRFRAGGYNLSACGKTKELAKENMRKKLMAAPSIESDPYAPCAVPETFTAFTTYYFENFRKEKVSPQTYKLNLQRCKNYLFKAFEERPISKILPGECKKLIDEVRGAGKSKTADDLYSLLSIIFKGAIAHGIIERNPMATVFHHKHERENGIALTVEEESRLLNAVQNTVYQHATALSLFCGLRPCELKTAVLDGDFIKTVNSKRKTKKVEYKRIYICDRLRDLLPEDGKFYICDLNKLRAKIRDVVPEHKLYDLRITFNTRCKELGVADHARMHFMGHSLGALGNAYTDLSNDYLHKEGSKLNEW